MDFQALKNRVMENEHKHKYILAALLCGILLMAVPIGSDSAEESECISDNYAVVREEQRLEKQLSLIEGVGECRVLLSVYDDTEQNISEGDERSTRESWRFGEEPSEPKLIFQGALVVAEGCESHTVRYDILSSVMAYTGLSVDQVIICQMQS